MRALEILLERRWILKSREKELYYQIKDELGTVKKFLMEKLGYQVIVNPYLVKVEKMPATPENWMGIQEFTRKIEYVFFCMILMFLEEKEAEEQFVLSELTEYIQGQYREEQIDWTVYQYRRHLIKVIKYCVNCGILNLNDGSEENFARDDTSEVLYENTGVSRYFMKNFTQDIMGYTTPEDQAEKESLSDSDTVKLKQREVEIKSQLEGLKKNITGKQRQEEEKLRERQFLAQLDRGGELSGFEVSLHIPQMSSVTPVRYMLDPEYISQETLSKENEKQQAQTAKEAKSWTSDPGDGSMYFFLDDWQGWRLSVAGAAAGSRFYQLDQTTDGGSTWNCANADPFGGQTGAAEGLQFFDENFGAAGLTGASRSHSSIYLTRDGGVSFEMIELPFDQVTELPKTAEEYGLAMEDYDYLSMPKQEGEKLLIRVTSEEAETDGFMFQSEDQGVTWEYQGVFQK